MILQQIWIYSSQNLPDVHNLQKRAKFKKRKYVETMETLINFYILDLSRDTLYFVKTMVSQLVPAVRLFSPTFSSSRMKHASYMVLLKHNGKKLV